MTKYRLIKKKLKQGFHLQFNNCLLYADKNYIRNWWEKDHKKRIKPSKKYSYIVQGGLDYWGEIEEWFLYTNKEIKEHIKNNGKYTLEYED